MKHSITVYRIRIYPSRNPKDLEILSEISTQNHDLHTLLDTVFKKLMRNSTNPKPIVDNKLLKKLLRIKHEIRDNGNIPVYYSGGRLISGILQSGAYGYEEDIVDTSGNNNYRKSKSEAQMKPFFFLIEIPKDETTAYLFIQRNSSDGIFNHSYGSLSSSDILIQNSEKLRSGYNCIAIKDTQNNINEFVNEFLEDNKLNLSFYFRFLENTIDFVISQWNGVRESDANIRKYLSFLQAQMNDFELALVFYFALSDRAKSYDKQPHLKNNIDKYGFLAYMPDSVLLDRNHQKIYTQTMFLFLGAKGRQEKAKFIEGCN